MKRAQRAVLAPIAVAFAAWTLASTLLWRFVTKRANIATVTHFVAAFGLAQGFPA